MSESGIFQDCVKYAITLIGDDEVLGDNANAYAREVAGIPDGVPIGADEIPEDSLQYKLYFTALSQWYQTLLGELIQRQVHIG